MLITSSSALAVPASHAESNAELVVPLETTTNSVTVEKRQNQCSLEYCQPLYNACVKSCESLENGDWYVVLNQVRNGGRCAILTGCSFDAETSPACEGCDVVLEGC